MFRCKSERNLWRGICQNGDKFTRKWFENDFSQGMEQETCHLREKRLTAWNPAVFSIRILLPRIGRYRELSSEKDGVKNDYGEHTEYLARITKKPDKRFTSFMQKSDEKRLAFFKIRPIIRTVY